MSEHWLKTWPHAFAAITRGEKRFEYRSEADRDFDVGDVLVLCLWDPELSYSRGGQLGAYVAASTGRPVLDAAVAAQVRRRVTHVLHGGRFGVPVGYCVMSIELLGG